MNLLCHNFKINAKRGFLPALLVDSPLAACYRVLTPDDPYQDQDDCEQEEEVDEPAERIGRYEAQGPEDQEDDSDSEKHGVRIKTLNPLLIRP